MEEVTTALGWSLDHLDPWPLGDEQVAENEIVVYPVVPDNTGLNHL